VVEYGGGSSSAATPDAKSCPHNATEAANLFGGVPTDWTAPSGSNGWFMVRKGTPADVFVPQGMKAAYPQLGNSLEIVDVMGPATLHQVYYLAISCP